MCQVSHGVGKQAVVVHKRGCNGTRRIVDHVEVVGKVNGQHTSATQGTALWVARGRGDTHANVGKPRPPAAEVTEPVVPHGNKSVR